MAIELNTPTLSFATYNFNVDGVLFNAVQWWCTRNEAWYLDLETADGGVVKKAIKLLPNIPLVSANLQYLPRGNFFVMKNTTDTIETKVTRDNFGKGLAYSLYFIFYSEV